MMKNKRLFLLSAAVTMMAANVNALERDTRMIYVSPAGQDGAKGTVSRPLKSPNEAVTVANAFLKKHPGGCVEIQFREGEYPVEETLRFEGEGRVALSASPGEHPVLVADKDITGWQETSMAGVLKADLKACGITDMGEISGNENRVDLYCNGTRQTLARWPNKGFETAGKAVGETDLGDTWIHVHGTKEGFFEYKNNRMDDWAKEKDPYLHGYWYWDWSEQIQKMQGLDTERKIVEMAKPYHWYGYRDNLRFYGLNLLCELDSVSEYYIDREEGIIYWYAPADFKAKEYRTTLSVAKGTLLEVKDMELFSVDGLGFRGGRGGAICIENGADCRVDNCTIEQFGVFAVQMKGGSHNTIRHCNVKEMGCVAFQLEGGDRKTLQPSGFEVKDCTVENFSLFQRTYAPAVSFQGMGLLVSHCRFEHSSSSAFTMNGNDIIIEYNQCFDLVTESDDQGGVDMGRDLTCLDNIYRYNHWRDIQGGMYAGAAGIRFDDGLSGQLVYGNVFERCGGVNFGAVQFNGGYDNYVTNNLFYDCTAAVSNQGWNKEFYEAYYDLEFARRIENVDGYGPEYRMRYLRLNRPSKDFPDVNYAVDNLAVKTPVMCKYPDKMREENNTLVNDDVQPMEYYLKPEVLKEYGLREIPFETFGPREKQ